MFSSFILIPFCCCWMTWDTFLTSSFHPNKIRKLTFWKDFGLKMKRIYIFGLSIHSYSNSKEIGWQAESFSNDSSMQYTWCTIVFRSIGTPIVFSEVITKYRSIISFEPNYKLCNNLHLSLLLGHQDVTYSGLHFFHLLASLANVYDNSTCLSWSQWVSWNFLKLVKILCRF